MAIPSDSDGEATRRLQGIALICGAVLMFTLLDTAAKYLTAFLPALEIAWIRFVGHAVFAFLVLRPWRKPSLYRTQRPVAQIIRSTFLFSSTVFNFLAIRTLQLDQTASIMFAAVFVMAALSGPLLGEWVGPRRWVAVVVGFIGVLVVIRPGTEAFEPAMLYSIAAMLSVSGYMLITRHLAATDSAEGMILFSALVPSVLLAPIALPTAEWPQSATVAIVLVCTGIIGGIGHWMLIHAHRLAPTPVLSPFLYTQLLWMTLAGYVFFDQLPDRSTLFGAALIIGSALYILYRERVRGSA
ncbi:DMT family transporter [Bauldia sp.]|uniref:DMT family transporter n=1 Tax=Bauldia sp. TaxID=2575872 RepID=UPI003BACAEBE